MGSDDKRGSSDARAERLSAALRANLLLRKRRARGMAAGNVAGASEPGRIGVEDFATPSTPDENGGADG